MKKGTQSAYDLPFLTDSSSNIAVYSNDYLVNIVDPDTLCNMRGSDLFCEMTKDADHFSVIKLLQSSQDIQIIDNFSPYNDKLFRCGDYKGQNISSWIGSPGSWLCVPPNYSPKDTNSASDGASVPMHTWYPSRNELAVDSSKGPIDIIPAHDKLCHIDNPHYLSCSKTPNTDFTEICNQGRCARLDAAIRFK